jgi:hypothetical protein
MSGLDRLKLINRTRRLNQFLNTRYTFKTRLRLEALAGAVNLDLGVAQGLGRLADLVVLHQDMAVAHLEFLELLCDRGR